VSELVRQLGRVLCAFGSHGRLKLVRRITDSVAELECDRCGRRILGTNVPDTARD
jgi:hypothetical protein